MDVGPVLSQARLAEADRVKAAHDQARQAEQNAEDYSQADSGLDPREIIGKDLAEDGVVDS